MFVAIKKRSFTKLGMAAFNLLKSDEELTLSLSAESTFFARINKANIRQITNADQGSIVLSFTKDNRAVRYIISFSGDFESDYKRMESAILQCRHDCATLPQDPYVTPIVNNGSMIEDHAGKIPNHTDLLESLLSSVQGIDFSGLLTAGPVVRSNMNSKGQFHWFSNESFYVDFSIYTPNQKAVKGIYSASEWSEKIFKEKINESTSQLKIFEKPEMKIEKGKYRTYFAPSAVGAFVDMMSWNAVSASALKQGNCPFKKLHDEDMNLSPLFSLTEDFSLGLVPRFNGLGEVSEERIPIITNGKLTTLLTSTRTSKEYGIPANGASEGEQFRSPSIATGILKKEDILKQLDTGIYVSNLHYLNWSDLPAARITGMTRYACFWVENGEIISPIKDMRFDETLYNCFGNELEALTDFCEVIPNTSTYDEREIGGNYVPGMLVNNFTYTL
jgi:predicted Zn-dependent protease